MATPLPSPSGPDLRRLFMIGVAASVLGLGLSLSFGLAEHDPRPHELRIAVAAGPGVGAALAAGLQRAQPGGFQLVSVAGPGAATSSVRSQAAAGALIVPASGAVTIVTAAAASVLQQQTITVALTAAARALDRPVAALDVVPLPHGDRAGLSVFVFELGLLLPSVIGSVGMFLLGARRRLWWRVATAIMFALLVAGADVLAMDTILGALTGAGPALIAIGFLGALSFVLFCAAVQALVGLSGTALAAAAFVFVGNAISGGSVPVGFLPNGQRQIAPWLPNNAIVRGVRDVVYFHGHDLGHPLLVLALWPAAAACVLTGVDLIHLGERRRRPHEAHEVYRTSGVAHLRRRLAARRHQAAEIAA